MSVPKFSGVFKSAKDLLNKAFSYDNKVEIKTKASNGATFTADASISDDNSHANANLKLQYQYDSFKVDKLTIGTDKKIVGEFVFQKAAPNTDVTFKFTDGTRASGADIDAKVGAVHKAENYTLTAEAAVIDGPNFDVSGLFGYQGFLFGASAVVNTTLLSSSSSDKDSKDGAVSLKDYNFLVGHKTDDYTLALTTKDRASKVQASLEHKATKELTAGTTVVFPISGKAAPSVTLGGQYKLDSAATLTGTATSDGKVSLAYKHKLSDFATLSTSAQVDALNIDTDKHKFGLTLNLGN